MRMRGGEREACIYTHTHTHTHTHTPAMRTGSCKSSGCTATLLQLTTASSTGAGAGAVEGTALPTPFDEGLDSQLKQRASRCAALHARVGRMKHPGSSTSLSRTAIGTFTELEVASVWFGPSPEVVSIGYLSSFCALVL